MALEHLFPSLLSALFSLAVGFFVVYKDWRNKRNLLFGIFCFGLFIQSMFAGLLYIVSSAKLALNLDLVSVVGILIGIVTFVHFAVEFTLVKKYKHVILITNYTIGLVFLLLTFTKNILSSVETDVTGYYGVAGQSFNLFMGYLILALLFSIVLFVTSFIESKNEIKKRDYRNRIKYILGSIVILGISAILDMLRKAGLLVLTNIDLTRFGIFIFLIGISYTIIKYRMLNIDIVLKKSITFGLAMIISAILYMLVQNFFEEYFHVIFGSKLGNASIISALFIAMFFDKIKDKTAFVLGIIFYFLFRKDVKKVGRKKKLLKEVKTEIKKQAKKKKK